uniref:trypsin n=1 Tax=Denticeps clupeoides TaxID=299321 RepID=A0AAY4AIP6_9TELE
MWGGLQVSSIYRDGRIVGGYECTPNSKPWMASLNYGYHFCGAVLINEQWVLSVAHCCPYAMQIMLGEHDLRVFEGTEQLLKTDTIIWHPQYDYQTLDYDIMLIKLFHPVKVTDAVRPVGDSGSPLICQGEVHGLVSWGQGCAQPNYPAVYVKVCEFLYWISDTLEANA